ncbi:MAG TPA: hypothetical protein VI299_12795 [Polyangiales bacterium]
MTNVHEHDEPWRALDAHPRAIVEALAAQDTFRATIGGLHALEVGWPRATQRATSRSSDVLIELTSGAQDAFELALSLPAEIAARWVDRALGGHGDSGLASASGTLSDAECGVLAYLASRTCKDLGTLSVRDVRTGSPPDTSVLWPIKLAGVTFACALAPWRAEALPGRHLLSASVFDHGPEAFRAGEVWISDHWNLSTTSDGLAGEVQLASAGCATTLDAIYTRGRVHAHAPGPARNGIEVVLASAEVRFIDLATIAAGEPFPLAPAQKVMLRRGPDTVAHGELVTWRGAVGVRINEA